MKYCYRFNSVLNSNHFLLNEKKEEIQLTFYNCICKFFDFRNQSIDYRLQGPPQCQHRLHVELLEHSTQLPSCEEPPVVQHHSLELWEPNDAHPAQQQPFQQPHLSLQSATDANDPDIKTDAKITSANSIFTCAIL